MSELDEEIDQPVDTDAPADGGDAKPEGSDDAPNDDAIEPAPEESDDYQKKFSESTKENQRILQENQKLKEDMTTLTTSVSELTQLNEELKRVASESNPDGTKILELEKSINALKTNIALNKEEVEVGKFIADNPEAAKVGESLRRMYRLNPTKSLAELWNENYAPLIQAAKDGADAKKIAQKKTQPERTSGGISTDPAAGELPADFATWPVAQRKEYLRKKGF